MLEETALVTKKKKWNYSLILSPANFVLLIIIIFFFFVLKNLVAKLTYTKLEE